MRKITAFIISSVHYFVLKTMFQVKKIKKLLITKKEKKKFLPNVELELATITVAGEHAEFIDMTTR